MCSLHYFIVYSLVLKILRSFSLRFWFWPWWSLGSTQSTSQTCKKCRFNKWVFHSHRFLIQNFYLQAYQMFTKPNPIPCPPTILAAVRYINRKERTFMPYLSFSVTAKNWRNDKARLCWVWHGGRNILWYWKREESNL